MLFVLQCWCSIVWQDDETISQLAHLATKCRLDNVPAINVFIESVNQFLEAAHLHLLVATVEEEEAIHESIQDLVSLANKYIPNSARDAVVFSATRVISLGHLRFARCTIAFEHGLT